MAGEATGMQADEGGISALVAEVSSTISDDEIIELLVEMVRCPRPTGSEAALAQLLV